MEKGPGRNRKSRPKVKLKVLTLNRKKVHHPLKLEEKRRGMGVNGDEIVVGGNGKFEQHILMASIFSVR